ncbi:hypothetical protein OMP38_24565 [Cohnella ginsengisoli]|uniref:Uncharacterized protein n=1 Tax=Cohnella ginsengisoli TaxID=425004 RepID=A0A9X4KKE5_9BACL|nr:hypothetical protein [Cohnella ginsengisoli]MDG0793648.1 hypothetical protein [Cohnella ginsengisoli]
MRAIIDLFGYLILVGGTIVGLMSGSVTLIVLSLFGGPVLLGVSHLIGIAENVQAHLLDLPPTMDTVRSFIKKAPEYAIDGSDAGIEVYPSADANYEWIELNGDVYMRSKPFRKYIEHVDNRYSFALPGRETVVLRAFDHYYKGAPLFWSDGHAYVMLSAIGLTGVRENDRVALRAIHPAEEAID